MTLTLAKPIDLRARHVPSRLVFGPHETNLGRVRGISNRQAAYYARRAQGGAGLVVTETASVHPSDWPYERAPLASDCADGWSATAAACHPHGTLVLASLGHAGMQGSSAYSQRALWAPGRVPDPATREMPMVMGQPEIEALLAGFASAATMAAAAGLDGVEVNAGQHSLLRQFHSGLTNLRDDAYGADRLLLTEEVLRAARAALGPDLVLGLRLCCDELAPWAGVTPDAAEDQAARLAQLVDYLVVVRGSIFSVSATRPDLHTEPDFNVDLCRQIRAAVGGAAAVVLQGSVVDPEQAERALTDGVADLVEMTRAQIADPDLMALCRDGHADRVRPCLLCNQACMARDARNPVVSCVIEPRSGHETTDPDTAGADLSGSQVLVVGGGPAGLEAARVLALRGHRVSLAERGPRLGGMFAVAALVHGRGRLGTVLDWWQRELARLGVSVRLGTEITTADLDSAAAEGTHVLLATGSVPGPRHYRIAADALVVEAADLVKLVHAGGLAAFPAGPALVFDPIGGPS
jgi:mycofactocin system FadH/OYE family oxidoreductase 1